MFSKEDFDLLAPIVDGFSLMTYDYPNFGKCVYINYFVIVSYCSTVASL